MSDEAREAGWRELTEKDQTQRGPYARAAFSAGFDAGVAEGRREGDEAVAALVKVAEWCDEAGYDLRAILDVEELPAAIDALAEEGNRG